MIRPIYHYPGAAIYIGKGEAGSETGFVRKKEYPFHEVF
jgi:hypothetical protein